MGAKPGLKATRLPQTRRADSGIGRGLAQARGNLTVTVPLKEVFEVLGRVRYYSEWYD